MYTLHNTYIHICIYIYTHTHYIYIYIHIYIYICIHTHDDSIREMGRAPRNPAPGNNFLVTIAQPSGCHCTDGHSTSIVFSEDQNIS